MTVRVSNLARETLISASRVRVSGVVRESLVATSRVRVSHVVRETLVSPIFTPPTEADLIASPLAGIVIDGNPTDEWLDNFTVTEL